MLIVDFNNGACSIINELFQYRRYKIKIKRQIVYYYNTFIDFIHYKKAAIQKFL